MVQTVCKDYYHMAGLAWIHKIYGYLTPDEILKINEFWIQKCSRQQKVYKIPQHAKSKICAVGAETIILNGQLVTVSFSLLIHVIKNLFYEYKLKLANDTRVT